MNLTMSIAEDITELIGRTPMVKLKTLPKEFQCQAKIIAKLENFNPTASIKDRIASSMIKDAEEKGLITPGLTTLVEATSGNTGIALAMVASAKNYRLILTMPDTMSTERRAMLRAYGAELLLTPGKEGMQGALNLAKEIVNETKHAYQLKQFDNPSNPLIHERTTALEILDQCEYKIDGLITGVGTGGTVTGCAKVIKEKIPQCKIYAVEPQNSPVLSGGKPGNHLIQGIGAGFVPSILKKELIDEIICISDNDAMQMGRLLAKREGLLCGISSGAAVAAAIKIGQREDQANKRLIVILPSFGERYLSTAMFTFNTSINPTIDGQL
tara:strand:+ start:1181 stop:2161 length:981 start_codon:yes stop_codon:yes gene_type:complete